MRTTSIPRTQAVAPTAISICVVYLQLPRYGQPLTSRQQTNCLPQNDPQPYKITSESGQPRSKVSVKNDLGPSFNVFNGQDVPFMLLFHYSSLRIFARDFHVHLAVSHRGVASDSNLRDVDNLSTADKLPAPNVSVIQRFHSI